MAKKLLKYLANLGYGSRREVERMLRDGRVTRTDGIALTEGDVFEHDDVRVDDEPLDPAPGVVILLHKPTGYVCSMADANPLVYDLLPERFRLRSPVIAPVGRLDLDTSGVLLLTDDGQFNHRITSPRTHLPKTYEATLASDLRGDEVELFASGAMVLNGESEALAPATLVITDKRHARVTITEGRYHQVRRMFAAVGNHAQSLHRSAIGELTLGALQPGEWRILQAEDRARLMHRNV